MIVVARKLSKRHRRELEEGSGLTADVIDARGYETVKDRARLLEFDYEPFQWTGSGLLVPIRDAYGDVVGTQWKADKPRTETVTDDDGNVTKTKALKYDNPMGSRVRLDIPRGAAAGLADASVPLWITEGAKKADAAVSAGLCCISVLGVWAWKSDGQPLRDWDSIQLDGREVLIAYDSDVMQKVEVQGALDALTTFLAERGARVAWVLLPDRPSLAGENAKVGLDDWLVDNGMEASGLVHRVRRPEINIKVNDVPLPVTTRQGIAALHQMNDPRRIFTRDDTLVEARGIGVQEVSKDRLTLLLGEAGSWFRTSEKGRRPVAPPPNIVTNVLAAGQELWKFDYLDRIVTTPVFAKDGTLRTEPGYHAASRSYYLPPDDLVVPDVAVNPTDEDVTKAKALIEELFEGFSFVGKADRAHAWAMLLQPFAREMIRGETPLYSVQAPKQGTGKTLLVQSALAAAVGVVDSHACPHGDEEMDKRLTAMMREAAPVFFLDNVDRVMSYASLASALTKPTWSGRVLGFSATSTMPIHCTFVMTANNPVFSDDIRRRVVPIRLDANLEDPSQRVGFKHSLPSWSLEHRSELVWAACTIISSWVAHKRPAPASSTATLGSYGPWRRVIGGILANAGVKGFLKNLSAKVEDKEPEQETFEAICAHAAEQFGVGAPWLARTLAESLWGSDLELVFSKPVRDEDLGRHLAYFLRSRKGQVVDGLRLQIYDRQSAANTWCLVPAGGGGS